MTTDASALLSPVVTSRKLVYAITPLIITFDEAPNVARTLEKLSWARRIVVIDSGSTDATLDIVARYPQAEVIHRQFDSFAEQCNFGLAQVQTDWVLSLDADYELSDALVEELQRLKEIEGIAAYRAAFIYRINGRALRGTLYPPRTVLYRVRGAQYVNEGHGHRVKIPGKVSDLHGAIYYDDRKPLSRWFASQQRYASYEAAYLLSSSRDSLSRNDRVRLAAWPSPFAVLFHTLFVQGCLLDGWVGWFYALQRVLAEVLLAMELVESSPRQPIRQ